MKRRLSNALLVLAALLAVLLWLGGRALATWGWVLQAVALALLLAVTLTLLYRGTKLFLWRVGRRLAVSYFLIGVLPIPMVSLLFLDTAYIHSGYFLGHLYRDAVSELTLELELAATDQVERLARGRQPVADDGAQTAFAIYRDRRRVAGFEEAPATWPEWLFAAAQTAPEEEIATREAPAPFVTLDDGTPTLVSGVEQDRIAVLAIFHGDIEAELARRANIVVKLSDPEATEDSSPIRVSIGEREFTFQEPLLGLRRTDEAIETAAAEPGAGGEPATATDPGAVARTEEEKTPLWDRRIIWWSELAGPIPDLADGSTRYDYIAAALGGTPRTVYRHLFSSSAEVDAAVWGSLLGIAGLLSTIYGIALAMALMMIFTLSRAVNHLSRATDQVRDGEFSIRIPVRRHDQIGELQRSFNSMAENLDSLVLTATQKELLERELTIARDLQQSLLPSDLPELEAVDIATLFEPSAAIGGDYFDIFELPSDRLAVIVADVSGHGLPTGLRMAMLKSALTLLVEQGKRPTEILEALDRMVRTQSDSRYFITLTIGILDLAAGTLELTNAGHPPTYVLRDGEVEEVVLPGPPLGGLGTAYGRRSLDLMPGDTLVWLSDGLIEAMDWEKRVFGYDGVRRALEGDATSAQQVRDRLVDAVARHTGTQPIDDDRSLVVMTYRPTSSSPSVE
jgi:serine phosphatase RsbU (regulator of sigma subunit)